MLVLNSTSEEILPQAIQRFWETFPSVWDTMRSNVRSIAVDHYGITVEQFHILRHIRKGCCSVSELATVKQISRPAISQSVEILVEMGLINRQHNTEDRRFVQLELTPNGNEMLNSIFEENRIWMVKKMEALRPEEINCILQSMEYLKKTFEQENG
jgi:MarR family transcriptional regulator, organic hydroperoxide resistance regulator